ncbi:helix-turn-helix transcriptional regulator [Citrobacter freundii]|nr:helix-turn-helix transcriptional regulator [Citrobacter freundii]
MFLIFTKDIMLLQAIYHLFKNDVIVHVQHVHELCAVENHNAKVIIDTLNNNIFHTRLAYQLEKIKPSKIYILSPFRIKRCFGDTPVFFVNRNVSLSSFISLLNCNENYAITPELSLSRRQHQILTDILQQRSCSSIAEQMHITLKTYHCHKYNIMLLLKLRKMSDLVRHKISSYLL